MSISNIVNVQISRLTTTPSRAGFGTGAFVSANATLEDATSYGSLQELTDASSDVGADSIAAGTSYFGQQLAPTRFTIIPEKSAVKQITTLSFSEDLVTGNSISVNLNGSDLIPPTDFGISHDDTMGNIAMQIEGEAAIFTADAGAPGSRTITITAELVDVVFTISAAVTGGATQATTLVITTQDAGGWAGTLDSAIKVNNDWYALAIYSRSATDIPEVSDWVQGQGANNPKIFFAQSADSDILTGSSSDIASLTQAKANFRTSIWYHSDSGDYLETGVMGANLPTAAGSITWAYKTIATIPVDVLTSGEKAAAHAKACNTYTEVASVNITEEGKVSDSPFEWIDVIRGVDWIQVNMTADLFSQLVNTPKIPYTTKGILSIKGTIAKRLTQAQTQGILTDDTAPVVTVPDIADVSAADKGNRVLNNVTFTGVLAGAVQKINVVGTVTL